MCDLHYTTELFSRFLLIYSNMFYSIGRGCMRRAYRRVARVLPPPPLILVENIHVYYICLFLYTYMYSSSKILSVNPEYKKHP